MSHRGVCVTGEKDHLESSINNINESSEQTTKIADPVRAPVQPKTNKQNHTQKLNN